MPIAGEEGIVPSAAGRSCDGRVYGPLAATGPCVACSSNPEVGQVLDDADGGDRSSAASSA